MIAGIVLIIFWIAVGYGAAKLIIPDEYPRYIR